MTRTRGNGPQLASEGRRIIEPTPAIIAGQAVSANVAALRATPPLRSSPMPAQPADQGALL